METPELLKGGKQIYGLVEIEENKHKPNGIYSLEKHFSKMIIFLPKKYINVNKDFATFLNSSFQVHGKIHFFLVTKFSCCV